ncbi:MAG TPA: molybdate ABC transporter substrate-binding protein [Xanthobacteraceae bacterium]
MSRIVALTAAFILCASAAPDRLDAAEIKVLSPGSTENAFNEIIPQFEKSSGYKLTIDYGPVGALAARVKKGEAADIAILSEPATEDLRKQSKLVAGSETVVAKVGIGAFVRKGDPKPDIGTVDAFMRALARAKVIAYADPKLGGSSSILVGELMNSLDITGSIGPKTKLVPPAKPLLDLVAAGGVDFGFNPISEILSDPRLDLVGPLPAGVQKYTLYVASLVATSQQQDAFKALVAFLSSPAAVAVLQAKGFEPL